MKANKSGTIFGGERDIESRTVSLGNLNSCSRNRPRSLAPRPKSYCFSFPVLVPFLGANGGGGGIGEEEVSIGSTPMIEQLANNEPSRRQQASKNTKNKKNPEWYGKTGRLAWLSARMVFRTRTPLLFKGLSRDGARCRFALPA